MQISKGDSCQCSRYSNIKGITHFPEAVKFPSIKACPELAEGGVSPLATGCVMLTVAVPWFFGRDCHSELAKNLALLYRNDCNLFTIDLIRHWRIMNPKSKREDLTKDQIKILSKIVKECLK